MNKRLFLSTTAASLFSLPAFSESKATQKKSSPSLLTVTGVIAKTNRGAMDVVLDQMMFKQKIHFDQAHSFDFAALLALPSTQFDTVLEYDQKSHHLSGPLVMDVLKVVGAKINDATKILLRAIDGYAVIVSVTDIKKYNYIVATHLDYQAMSLGGLGPLWAVFDADAHPQSAAKPVNERFALCPWGLYHIEVLAQ